VYVLYATVYVIRDSQARLILLFYYYAGIASNEARSLNSTFFHKVLTSILQNQQKGFKATEDVLLSEDKIHSFNLQYLFFSRYQLPKKLNYMNVIY
jgi:hypothetical protein